jgi:hypothetical protein
MRLPPRRYRRSRFREAAADASVVDVPTVCGRRADQALGSGEVDIAAIGVGTAEEAGDRVAEVPDHARRFGSDQRNLAVLPLEEIAAAFDRTGRQRVKRVEVESTAVGEDGRLDHALRWVRIRRFGDRREFMFREGRAAVVTAGHADSGVVLGGEEVDHRHFIGDTKCRFEGQPVSVRARTRGPPSRGDQGSTAERLGLADQTDEAD